ncbi:hypothetical protein RB614_43485 [Phytohabitans sp. ZYX-F-186]|uniref:Uncharacterized protein n=1 Tax=Phytohabitans maris TaxID=3071409 RepID=A0ABU0ZXX5_9ACTN|nr:hypothetical protein [Phytohabitans sp. ZYX-F-186]MDQ7911372.1 hypothetical protein [Phytohabitans sp. ZYX-F-186]
MLEADLQRLMAARRTPTLRPMLPPVCALVAVTDTNVLARQACRLVREVGGGDGLVTGLAATGRSNVFVGAHVPGELAERLTVVAASTGVGIADAERALWEEVMPSVAVVDVAVGDCLSPRAKRVLRDDSILPRSMRGDPDDVETVAVAELLAPAVVLSADSVFARLGMASASVSWVGAAQSLLRAAGFEASLADAAFVVEVAGRLLFLGAGAGARLAARYPLPALAVAAAAVYLAWRYDFLDRDRLRSGIRRLGDVVEPVAEIFGAAADGWARARQALFVIEPVGSPTTEQLAARHLVRCGRALTPSELGDELPYAGHRITAAALKRTMRAHPAFLRLPGDRYVVGRTAVRPRAA